METAVKLVSVKHSLDPVAIHVEWDSWDGVAQTNAEHLEAVTLPDDVGGHLGGLGDGPHYGVGPGNHRLRREALKTILPADL